MSVIEKKELLSKLERISALYDDALSIKIRMDGYEPVDCYERKVLIPIFPGDYEDVDEREEWEMSVDHTDEDAVEQMLEAYDSSYCPREPRKPVAEKRPEPEPALTNDYKKKKGCFPLVGGFAAVCALISGGLFSDDTVTKAVNLAIIAAGVIAVLAFLIKVKKLKAADEEVAQLMIRGYEHRQQEQQENYEREMQEYRSLMSSFELARADFESEYIEWRKAYLAGLDEEAEIAVKLEADRAAAVKEMEKEEYAPAVQKLTLANDLVPAEYLPAVDVLIALIQDGRADDLKEAINLYEDMLYRERQLQLQREQEEQRRYEEEQRRQEEERRYRQEMKLQKEQEQQRMYDERSRQYEELKKSAVEARERRAKEWEVERKAKQEAESRCHWCKKFRTCGVKNNPPLNCVAFDPGSTHQI